MSSAAVAHVDGVVLAAGRSARMGSPKPLLRIGGRSFLERAVDALREGGCRRVVVVAPVTPVAIAEAGLATGAHVVVNEDGQSQQVDSLRLGLGALGEDAAAVVVLPVDHPLVRPETVAALLAAFRERRKPVVRATFHDRPGHPTLFSRLTFDELGSRRLERGAESVVMAHAADVEDVAVEDPGVTSDIDSPDEIEPWRDPE